MGDLKPLIVPIKFGDAIYGKTTDTLHVIDDTETACNSLVWVKMAEGTIDSDIDSDKDIRIFFQLYTTTPPGNHAFGQIRKNGVAIGTIQEDESTEWTDYSEDIAGWSNGDTIELWMYNSDIINDGKFRYFRVLGVNTTIDNFPVLLA